MINSFKEAIDFFKSTIPVTAVKKFPGAKGLERQERLLELLGNPQDKIKVIHIAGTTGKTSTVKIINDLLIGQGFKVGLTVSPHLIDIRERIQINNELISEEDFVKNLNAIMPAIKEVAKSKLEMPTYFEVMVALFYYSFGKAKVDYAVIETGMGGTNDGTNTIHSENKIAVITPIGLDHTKILGKTISEIAQKKAGIINKFNPVFSAPQNINAVKVLNERAKQKSTKINKN